MTIHILKILPEYYAAVESGLKKAELRKDDRGFEVGDLIDLYEWTGRRYTGKVQRVAITHILRDCPEYGLKEGYCILSIKRIWRFN